MDDRKNQPGVFVGIVEQLTRRDVLKGSAAVGLALTVHPVLGMTNTSKDPVTLAGKLSLNALAALFQEPPLEYAPVDNWWWEAGRVERERLTVQLQAMKDRGIGGSWFYVRWVYGEELTSDPPYWSDEWWDLTRHSVEEHKRLGLTHYFSNWTLTQFQQDLVRKEKESDPTLEGRILVIYRRDTDGRLEFDIDDEVLDAAAYRRAGQSVDFSSRRDVTASVREGSLEWRAPGPDWLVTVIAAKRWDLNYLDKRVGQRFTEAFLGEYEKRMPEFIGSPLESFGADEMILLNGEMLYSQSILDKVRTKRGYDLGPYLIGLFHDIGAKTDQIRCDYYDALTALLEQNFYQPPSTWLESRGMKHSTVSQLGAGDPLQQTAQLGDFFRYLRTFHEPGNEDPGWTKPGERRLLASKLSSSVAHLYGRSRAVMCVHYVAGWGQTQEENLAWTNESYAKGLNFYTRHGAQYSLMGGWYEYVPPSDHFHQPVWRYWKSVTEYVTRLSCLLSQGKHRADVALFYPITTIHAHWVAGRSDDDLLVEEQIALAAVSGSSGPFDPLAVEASESLQSLAHAIYHDGIDFNFTDNESLERSEARGKILAVSGVEFRSIVLPAISTIRLASMEKVREFYVGGGTVVSYGRLPTASAENGRGDPALRALVEAVFGAVSDEGIPSTTHQGNARGGQALFVSSDIGRVPSLLSEAIVRDVWAPEKDLFHLHKKVDEADVYFLFNVQPQARELPVRFRAQGRVEIWDPFTGEARPAHRWIHVGEEQTEVTLAMGPNEGVIVVFSPGEAGPAVVEDNVSELVDVTVSGNELSISGYDAIGGRKRVRLRHAGQEYTAEAQVDAPPEVVNLTEAFAFRLEPTMDNRWGDFRYPASDAVIGAEARTFRYAEEDGVEGAERGWHLADFRDTQWEEVTYSYGPYWWHLGGFPAGTEPRELIEQARRSNVDVNRSWSHGARRLSWQRYSFSQKFGNAVVPDTGFFGGLLGVPENFLMLNEPAPGNDRHYFFTSIQAPEDVESFLYVGTAQPKLWASLPFVKAYTAVQVPNRIRAWINGHETTVNFDSERAHDRIPVKLRRGRNAVLLEVVRPAEGPVALYAAFAQSEPVVEDRYVPLLKWFREPQQLVYDIMPEKTMRIGWYRFKAPPGTRVMRLFVDGKVLQAWVDGRSVSIDDNEIVLRAARPQVSQVALRVEQEPGCYGGVAFREPVAFDCETGEILLGDWSAQGLSTYSGIGVYSQEVHLQHQHLAGKVILDLGSVRSVAEVFVNGDPAGVKLSRPFRFDVTNLVRGGTNRIEIKVANTLANHMSTYPTPWVLEGQTVSGLMGPVTLQFHAPVSLTGREV